MKKRLFLFAITALVTTMIYAGEEAETWARLYRRLEDPEQRYMVMQNIAVLDDRSMEPFLKESLDDLVYGESSQYRTNPETFPRWERLTRTIVKELGEIKGQSAATSVWDVARSAETPLLKADALIALGQMRAEEYADDIGLILRNLNFASRSDKEAAEKEAFGAVVALDKMKSVVGYEPVFYASIGWYSKRVTDLAREALARMLADPSGELIRIMEESQNYVHKRLALETALGSGMPTERKIAVAVAALNDSHGRNEADYTRRRELADVRLTAIQALIVLGSTDPAAIDPLDRSIEDGELDEKLIAIQALGVDGTDGAVAVLTRRLEEFNDRQLSGLKANREELTIISQIVFALGEAGNENAVPALRAMEFADYTPAMIRQAEEAMASINGN